MATAAPRVAGEAPSTEPVLAAYVIYARLDARGGGSEQADGIRHGGDFPAEWCQPEGARFSAERAAWVRTRVAMHERAKRSASAALERIRQLQRGD